MWTRRQFLTRSGLSLATAGTCFAFPGQGDSGRPGRETLPDGSAARGMITDETDRAINRGLVYLARSRRQDGSFGTNGYQGNVAVSSLCPLAFMAAGNQPNRGPYGQIVTEGARFVVKQEGGGGRRGFLNNPHAGPHNGPMYGHGFGTLFLAEVSGMVQDHALSEEVRRCLHAAVRLILNSQNPDGGWRYQPDGREADISVTICQIMALRAAKNAGVDVPKAKVDKCVSYVKRCQDLPGGSFRYMIAAGPQFLQPAFARTAAGVVALYSAGIYDGINVEAGLGYLMNNVPDGRNRVTPRDIHYFYGHYYAVQAMYTAGGKYWARWYPAIRDELLGSQLPDGSWRDAICPHYATAMACLILQVPNNYLPILQK